jgi:death-on-curing protein
VSGPVWVPIRAVVAIHDRQIARHGGRPGLRDMALLEAGCARALNLHAYGQPSLAEIAAAYAFGIAKAHAFVDGNKRTAFVTAATFLRLNGRSFRPDPVEGVRMMEALASGAITEAAFAAWLADGMRPLA